MARAGALAALLALALLACGSESKQDQREGEDKEQIEATAKRFAVAVAAKDTKAFCKLLAPAGKELLAREGRRCLVVWGADRNPLFKVSDPDLELEQITKLDRPSATAELANGGRLVFTRAHHTWYVNLAPAKK